MTSPFSLLALPVLLAISVAVFPRLARGSILATLYLLAAVSLLPVVASDESLRFSLPWVPGLGMEFGLRMTSFTAWFGFLIFSIGSAIILYASSYFANNRRLPSLLIYLLLFTSAMLGVIWSDNFFLLFLFWEATSLLSFLLVGFHHDQAETRAKAAQTLLVTFTGGAALLGGFILLQEHFGTASISALLEMKITEGPLVTGAVILIILGTLTKSAQWPFHFWLPNAMAGPSPVSAYLHSATMVKAGVFLLATLAPFLSSHFLWTPTLVSAGLLTITVAVIRGSREDDVKGILASTTLAALGFLTILAGVGTPAALMAFVIFLTAHALYKAPLFLAAGNLEKRFGTRKLSRLRGAIHQTPLTGAVIVLSIISLLGLPPFPGFLAKEYLLKAMWAESPPLAIAVALAAAGTLMLGLRLLLPMLLRDHKLESVNPLPRTMAVATALPACLAFILVATSSSSLDHLISPAATALGAPTNAIYHYWYGWTPALGLGMGALLLSALMAYFIIKTRSSQETSKSVFEELYELTLTALGGISKGCASLLKKGSLQSHLAVILATVGGLAMVSLQIQEWPQLPNSTNADSAVFITLIPAIAIATIVAARAKTTLSILVSLGFVGLLIAFLYLWFSAPDVALTQLLAETLLLFLMAGVLTKAKIQRPPKNSSFWRFLFASSAGILVTFLILKAMALEWDHSASDYYLTQSKSTAFGANVVNVILVDFRALDTLGEITVLLIAALGANAALGAARRRAPIPGTSSTTWLNAGLPLIIALLIPTALWIFWRGHNAPGGGFIAALLVASAVGLGLLGGWKALHPQRMRLLSQRLLIVGLSLSLLASLLPIFQGKPFFTGLWLHFDTLHLGTPLIFDLGVFLTVIGFTLSYLRHFHLTRS